MGSKPGWKHTQDAKDRIRAGNKKSWTPERHKKASAFFTNAFRTGKLIPPHTGHKQTAYQKKRVSESKRGTTWSSKTHQKVRENNAVIPKELRLAKALPHIAKACKVAAEICIIENRVKVALQNLRIHQERQKVFSPYIVDFYLPQYHIVIECDDNGHNTNKGKRRDRERDAFLTKKFQLQVIHLKEPDILQNTAKTVREALRGLI